MAIGTIGSQAKKYFKINVFPPLSLEPAGPCQKYRAINAQTRRGCKVKSLAFCDLLLL